LPFAELSLFKKNPTITGIYSNDQDLASVLLSFLMGRYAKIPRKEFFRA
jgi:hypothetical protein